jgi:hypothetical protein
LGEDVVRAEAPLTEKELEIQLVENLIKYLQQFDHTGDPNKQVYPDFSDAGISSIEDAVQYLKDFKPTQLSDNRGIGDIADAVNTRVLYDQIEVTVPGFEFRKENNLHSIQDQIRQIRSQLEHADFLGAGDGIVLLEQQPDVYKETLEQLLKEKKLIEEMGEDEFDFKNHVLGIDELIDQIYEQQSGFLRNHEFLPYINDLYKQVENLAAINDLATLQGKAYRIGDAREVLDSKVDYAWKQKLKSIWISSGYLEETNKALKTRFDIELRDLSKESFGKVLQQIEKQLPVLQQEISSQQAEYDASLAEANEISRLQSVRGLISRFRADIALWKKWKSRDSKTVYPSNSVLRDLKDKLTAYQAVLKFRDEGDFARLMEFKVLANTVGEKLAGIDVAEDEVE